MKPAPSIMQDSKECYITGEDYNLHRHHVFGGIRRAASDRWGCWIWLRPDYHNMSSHGIHFDPALDLRIKQETQRRFEELYGHEQFMAVFGKNYL